MESKPKIFLVTGPPLNGRDEHLKKVIEILTKRGRNVKYYKVFKYMQYVAQRYGIENLTEENVLELSHELLSRIREEAFNFIAEEIRDAPNAIHIISTPNVFLLKPHRGVASSFMSSLPYELLINKLPQLNSIIVAIDEALNVLKRWENNEIWKNRIPHLTLERILQLRQRSIEDIEKLTQEYYRNKGQIVNYLIYSVQHEPSVLADIIEDIKPRIYLSYNMTGIPQENFKQVIDFKNKLEKFFTVLDPGTISEWRIVEKYDKALEEAREKITIEFDEGEKDFDVYDLENAINLMRAQIVFRDYNLIHNSHAICVYHHGQYPSYGVMAEVIEASNKGKPVYVLYPYKSRLSPFFEYYVSTDMPSKTRILSLRLINDKKRLEEIIINKMLEEACKGLWTTWKPRKEFVNEYCKKYIKNNAG